jgi:hypothetical protein
MTNLFDPIRRLFTPVQRLPAGMYHYQAPPEDPRNYRLHLRLEPDGSGVLIVNAATLLHLNHTAAEYAYYLIQNLPADQVARKMASRYHVNLEQAKIDYENLSERLQTLINTPDLDPVTFLDFERLTPHSGRISAPYRLDCALTYRLPGDTVPEVAPTERVKRELSAAEWMTILDKAWSVGIPHVVFTGGEPTLRDDLPDLIAHAEANSQVTGLLSDGLRLVDKDYLHKLLQTGLDHLMILFQPNNQQSWKALENSMVEDLFVAVHLTINADNQGQVSSLLKQLADMGVKAISLSADNVGLTTAMQTARQQVANLHLELVWDLPVPYSAFHPVAMEIGQAEAPEGAGRAWLYVEPDGDVLPTQGVNQVLGNILNDPWEKIWKRS